MIFGRHCSRLTRLRLALLATCALVMQQLTFSAYACVSPAVPVAMAAHCQGMALPATSRGSNALCGHHCAQPTTCVADARMPTVPAALLPAMMPGATAPISSAALSAAPAFCVAPHPSPPPATILYCTLQI